MMKIRKYDIVLVNLNPTRGSEQKGIRPCLVVQNNLANEFGSTTVVCPITSVIKPYPHSLIIKPSKQNGLKKKSRVDFLQIRTISDQRIEKRLGRLELNYLSDFKRAFGVAFDLDDLFD